MPTLDEIIIALHNLNDLDKANYLLSNCSIGYKPFLNSFNKYRLNYYFEIIFCISFIGKRNGEQPIIDLKHKGAFLLFEDIEFSSFIVESIDRLLALQTNICFSESELCYFESKKKLNKVKKRYLKDINQSLNYIKDFGAKGVADVMSFCSLSFIKNNTNFYDNYDYNDFKNYSYLEWCDGASLLLSHYLKSGIHFGAKKKEIYLNDGLEDLLKPFVKLSKIKEFEMYCDYFDYDMKFDGKTITIVPPNLWIGKSIDLGFLMDQQAQLALALEATQTNKNNNADSLANYLSSESLIELLFIDDHSFPRYVYSINTKISPFLSKDFLLNEEYLIESILVKDLLITYEEINNFKIEDNITLIDIIKFRRLFMVIAHLFFNTKMEEKIFYNSATQLSSIDEIKKMLGDLYPNNNKIDALIDLFDFGNHDNVKDLLYCPFVKYGDKYFYSPILVGYSSLERNSIQLAKKRSVNEDRFKVINNRQEYVEYYLKQICDKNGIPCITGDSNLSFKYQDKEGEVDAIIYDDRYLIIVECKSPTSSTNNHELKSIYDYLNKAKKQLDFSLRAFSDQDFYNRKMNQLGIDNNPRIIKTLICNASRSFNGYDIGNHPVRSIKELYNVLDTGEIIIRNFVFNIRKGNNAFEWLLYYISPNSFLFDTFCSMDESYTTFYYGGYNFKFARYGLNIQKQLRLFNSKYQLLKKKVL